MNKDSKLSGLINMNYHLKNVSCGPKPGQPLAQTKVREF